MEKAINLGKKHQEQKELYLSKLKHFDYYRTEHPKYKIGQIIEFYGGFNDDILYRSEILGFDNENNIFVLWDCYWFPIKDNKIRQIKLISDIPQKILQLKFVGIDDFNRPIFKDIEKKKFYGSTEKLYCFNDDEKKIISEINKNIYLLSYFGTSFNCEPLGRPITNYGEIIIVN